MGETTESHVVTYALRALATARDAARPAAGRPGAAGPGTGG